MRWITSLMYLFLIAATAFAQTDAEQPTYLQEEKQVYIKFHLEKPAQSIESIKIKETGEALEGVISADGQFVTVMGLEHKRRLVVDVTYQDGTSETIEKSPCVLFEEYAI